MKLMTATLTTVDFKKGPPRERVAGEATMETMMMLATAVFMMAMGRAARRTIERAAQATVRRRAMTMTRMANMNPVRAAVSRRMMRRKRRRRVTDPGNMIGTMAASAKAQGTKSLQDTKFQKRGGRAKKLPARMRQVEKSLPRVRKMNLFLPPKGTDGGKTCRLKKDARISKRRTRPGEGFLAMLRRLQRENL